MATRDRPPFRSDQVGSLLRPAEVRQARERHRSGEISADALRAVEDEAIREAVRRQEELGLRAITDGEFRRTMFHTDFLEQLDGVGLRGGIASTFQRADGAIDFAPPRLVVEGKLAHRRPIQRRDFEFLQGATEGVAKVCIPSPTMVHFRGGREAIDAETYPDLEEFFEDLAQCYREEIAGLASSGCTYLQLDDTNLAYLCDPELRDGARARGDDPEALPHLYAGLINAALRDRPAEMAVTVHLCRGNFQSAWVAEGGYEPVAEVLFNELDVDGLFLEYDDERSGDFAPLRLVPPDKTVVLGLVTSKTAALESKDDLKRRIDEAAAYVPLEQLCLSPQCGFSSTEHGNQISDDDQWAKLQLVVETASEVWGAD